jgi:hypothetical protein
MSSPFLYQNLVLVTLCYTTYVAISVADPRHFGTDPDPAIFVIDLQDAYKKLISKKNLLITFFMYIYIIFQRKKVKKKSQKVGIKFFLTIFA